MGAVEPPLPTYSPSLPAAVVNDGLLSLAQLETVVYAGQAHSEQLPSGARKGYFVGDGTGVGKGREISGVILDNLAQGRSKAVWISCSAGLIEDARRDFAAVGGDPELIFAQGRIKTANTIAHEQGILFTTYATLHSGQKKQASDRDSAAGKTRLAQIVDWLGADFDGVIAFDEAHRMGNAMVVEGARGRRQPSQQAIAGLNLQRELPDARVLYVSATGATEVSNLTYAERLGLWGEGTAFADGREFVGEVSDGGIAAMELVARDMKALGIYSARSLSYDDVTYERLEHELTDLQRDIYDELAGAWQIVLQNVDEALELTGADGSANAKSAAMSMFWGAHQRFFIQVLTAFQTPAVIDHMREQLDAGHAAVVQLVNTNEAAQERIVAAATAAGTALEDLDFTPRQMLMDYVRNGFPVAAFEKVRDAEGNISSVPVKDAAGNPVFDQRAIELRDALLGTLQAIRVPENPLDSIINSFGTDQVAEVTGRSRRFVELRDDDGNLRVVEQKRGKNASPLDASLFQSDEKRILVFSGAGGTGYSFHADNAAENRRRRFHYILQPGWAAQGAVQGFGRSHRTNQASAPHYVLPTTDLKAQKRFISSIARRLDQLGALTRGQRQATSQGLFTAADNLESHYATTGLQNLFLDLHRGRTALSFADVTKQMGLNLLDEDGALIQGKIPDIPQFLNRLLSLKTDMQNAVFDEFEKRLVEAVEYAKQQGFYDEGLQTLRALNISKTRDEVVYTHKSGAETRYIELDVTQAVDYLQWDEISATARYEEHSPGAKDSLSGWFVSERGKTKGQVFYMLDRGLRINADGVEKHRGTLYGIRDGEHRYVDNADEIARGYVTRYSSGYAEQVRLARSVTAEQAETLWNAEIAAAPSTEISQESMLVGAILPIWDRVAASNTIYRLQTDSGEQLLGRRLNDSGAKQTLKNLGIDSGLAKLSTRDLFAAIKSGQKAVLSNGWEIVSARVAYEPRIEVQRAGAFTEAEKRILKEQGAFIERISWVERVFIPTGPDGLAVFERLTGSKPVVDLFAQQSKDRADQIPSAEQDDHLHHGVPANASDPPQSDRSLVSAQKVPNGPAPTLAAENPIRESRNMAAQKTPYHEQVASQIIQQLEQGTAPWQRPWKAGELSLPYNAATGKQYHGINSMWLHTQGYADPRWLTYKQAASMGAQVRGGSKGTHILYWKFREEKKVIDANGEEKTVTLELERPRSFHGVVFNAEQIDGLEPLPSKQVGPDPQVHERAEAILENSHADIRHVRGNRAYYSPRTDSITLPERNQFHSPGDYYATALHELGHWTGHASRLNRDSRHPFGSALYAREELRAELASLMLSERLGIDFDPQQHVSYVGSWIKTLKDDPREIFRAASDAERITAYVMDFEHQLEQSQQPSAIPSSVAPRQADETADHPIQHTPPKPEDTMPSRIYLAVPYAEKDKAKAAAKAAGFTLRWDKQAKAWWAPEGADLSRLASWKADSPRVHTAPAKSTHEQFADALADAGLIIDGMPIMDGKIHRLPVDGDRPGETSGAYAGHLEGHIPGGYIQNYKTGERVNWKAEGPVGKLTTEERAQLAAESAKRLHQRQLDLLAKYTATAAAAEMLWNEAPNATSSNAYCKSKGITTPSGLRVVPNAVSPATAATGIKIAQTVAQAKEMRAADPDARVFMAGDLLIPGRDTDGKLWTLQSVNPAFKSFMKNGRKHGLFTVAGINPQGKDIGALLKSAREPLILAEGYATADTVAALAGTPTIVAFDSGNLDAVAQELRDRFPERAMLIASDNDHNAPKTLGPDGRPRPNVGLHKATEAAKKHGAGLAVPPFNDGEKGSDWNDLRELRGNDATRRLLSEQLAVAKRDAAITAERLSMLARERYQQARNDPTTSADDARVAAERAKAAETITAASEQHSAVRSAAADGLMTGRTNTPATSAITAGIDRKTSSMHEQAKRERHDIRNNSKHRRQQGQDAGL